MNAKYESLLKPIKLPFSGLELNNRILMAPMTTYSGNDDGTITEDEFLYYEARSGGVGAVITACVFVTPQGRGFPGQPGVHSDDMLPGLKRLAQTIKSKGSLAILQIHHGGRMSPPNLLPDGVPVSASAVAAAQEGSAVPREMREQEILETIEAFGNAAKRAIQAGFDGVEIHGANTYLIQQFFSPHSNRRNDSWGGDIQKRMKFPLSVVDRVIGAVKEHADRPFAVGSRLSPEEIENPGITTEDTLLLVSELASKRLDYIHVSTANFFGGSLRNKEDKTPRALLIREKIGDKIPVIGVGSVNTPEQALSILELGVSLVSLGREILMEPEWVQKVKSGRESEIRTTLPTDARKDLVIPEKLWKMLLSRKGWLPVVEK